MNAHRQPSDGGTKGRSENGFTLLEMIISVVILAMITGAISAAFVTGLNSSGATTSRVHTSDDAQTIAAFLVRDAQAAGGTDPTNPTVGRDPSLGVSLGAPTTCGTGSPTIAFAWRDWVTPTVSHLHVVNYFYDSGAKQLTRTTCTDGVGPTAPVTLGNNLTSVAASCSPAAQCPGIPDSVSLTITATNVSTAFASSPYTYTLNATVRPQNQAITPGTPVGFPTFLVLGGSCPSTPGITAGGSGTTVTVNGQTVINGQTNPPTPGSPPCGLLSPGPATFTSTPAPVYPPGGLPDPFSTLPPPNLGGVPFNESTSCLNQPNPGPVAGHYSPGLYQRSLSITTAITFDPGVYFFCNGLGVSGNGVVTANGVLFYVAQGAFTIQGNNVSATMSGLTSGPDAGFVIWMPKTNTTASITLAGNSTVNQYNGLIYAPGAAVMLSGSAGVQIGSIIARTINFSGNQSTHIGPYTPTVGAPNPTSGAVGTSVTINGSGFVASSPLTITVGGTNATITAGATTDANGNAAATFTIPAALAPGNYTVSVTDGGGNTANSATQFAVLPSFGPPTKLVFTRQPSNSIPNAVFPTQPQVTVEDALGRTVTNDASTVTLAITPSTPTSGGPGALSGCTQTETLGVITFSGCKINTAGVGYKLHATDGALTAADSGAFNVAVGAVSQFLVTPSTATPNAGSAFTVTLTAEDAAGNPVTTYTGLHTIAWSGASISPTGNAPTYPATAVTFTNGVSTTALNATLFSAGSNTFTASATTPTVTGSATVTVQAGSAAGIVLSSIATAPTPALSNTGTVGTTLAYTSTGEANNSGNVLTAKVSVADSYGNPVNTATTQTIDLATAGSGAVVPTGASALTINAGTSTTTATFTLTRTTGNGKSVTLTATVHGTTQKFSVTLSS